MEDSTGTSVGFYKVGRIQKICLSERYADEKVNAMLQAGWKILDSYKDAYEIDTCCVGGSNLYYVLGHEDANAQIPLTEREIEDQRRREEERKHAEEQWLKIMKEEDMT